MKPFRIATRTVRERHGSRLTFLATLEIPALSIRILNPVVKMAAFIALLAIILVPALHADEKKIVSPEIHPDRTVTFRVHAPGAASVLLGGEWMPGEFKSLTKNERDVWTITIGPLEPGISIYRFGVDGVWMSDPVNPRVKTSSYGSGSLLEIPGDPAELWEIRDVPHGTVSIVWHASKVTSDDRAFRVYTPPGYEESRPDEEFPVLYLFHGANCTEALWTDTNRVNFVLDNLIAKGAVEPMVLVMPWGHCVPILSSHEKNTDLMESYVLTEVMPEVERRFRVKTGPEHTAVAGFSMGGRQALVIGLRNPDTFSSVGGIAAWPWRIKDNPSGVNDEPSGLIDDVGQAVDGKAGDLNAKIRLIWIGCGKSDPFYKANQKASKWLTEKGVKHTVFETEGGHTTDCATGLLIELLPKLFRKG